MKTETRILQIKVMMNDGIAEVKVHGGSKSKEGCCFDIMPIGDLIVVKNKLNKAIKMKKELTK